MTPSPFRTARAAWDYLVLQGGLDIDDRDQPLAETLRYRLNPHAVTVEDALDGVSVEGFLNIFFGALTPFVGMMRDLLTYFESAGATEGPEAWTLALGEGDDRLEVNLDHFRKWIEGATATLSQLRQVPILDYDGLWALRKHFYPLGESSTDSLGQVWHSQPAPAVIAPDLDAWLKAYDEGTFRPLPQVVLDVYRQDDAVADVAALVMEIYGAVTSLAPTRQALEQRGRYSSDQPASDFWSVNNLRSFESDLWVKGRVLELAAWEEAPPALQRAVSDSLARQLRDLPRRMARLNVTIQEIEQILSLPVWKRRYELYSAWVLTSILHALRGHSIQLHHDHGVISFSFRETLMATILSSDPPLQVFAEKRTAAVNPVGHGRTAGIQPDYSLWTDADRCPLAVECKHYKKSSTSNFAAALNDYSAALPHAEVILTNYGPVSPAVEQAIAASRSDRCRALGNVHPEAAENRAAFEKLVRRVVGAPVPIPFAPDTPISGLGGRPVLLVDVSLSMQPILAQAEAGSLIEKFVRTNRIQTIVAADERALVQTGVSAGEIASVIAATGTGNTNLNQPVRQLLDSFTAVVVLTDAEGARDLGGLSPVEHGKLRLAGTDIFLLSVTRPG